MEIFEPMTFVVGGRYGYSAIDVYRGDSCMRTAVAGITRKLAESLRGELAEAYRQGTKDLASDLVGITEIANHFGVKCNVVGNWVNRYESFPKPVTTLAVGKVWRLSEIAAWRVSEDAPRLIGGWLPLPTA